MRRLPPLAAIRAFEAAARTENFTAAAAELGMTQAAVSYQVKSLEERLGAPLFVREKGRARLTPLGARLLPALSSAFDAIEAAFASHREEDESLLTITTTHTFANTWLAWRLGAFQMEHPDLAVRMTTSNELCDLRGGDADVAVRAGGGGWACRSRTGFPAANGPIGWSSRASGGWCPRSSASANGFSTKCASRSTRSTGAGRRRAGFRRWRGRRQAEGRDAERTARVKLSL